MKEIAAADRLEGYLVQYALEEIFPSALRQHLVLYRFEPDEALCTQGEEPQHIFYLVQGKVKIYTTSAEGNTLLLNFTSPLGVLGEIECLSELNNLNTVTAVTAVEAIGVHKRWLRLYREEVPFLQFMLQMISEKFYSKSVALSFNLLYPVEIRLASYLLSVTSPGEAKVSTANLKDMANLIGTSYRHLNRVILNFCRMQLVERSRGTLMIKDRAGLEAVAGRNIYENGERRDLR
ncbi:cyclic nucleotide-binding domain-containing protein [Paenibacillus rhizovicinus]|uniref:Cyclic nucleotide-binding domain-containing protein n=1 Tax=Paenibacillus rhizovicinus TaxID=2704463 RepID=A0A6C0NU94_9BACL|nr:cyclic nucleotide-binding domain-containing protein [Paenibacillus rhizovicinus]QHW29789.1 cyclic nucleotide-binding domain-containing protein [Paenibacillus rhizovicinus]